MASLAVFPALAFVAGAAFGVRFPAPPYLTFAIAAGCLVLAVMAAWRSAGWLVLFCVVAGTAASGIAVASHHRERLLKTSLRDVLDERIGGFDIDRILATRSESPIPTRMHIVEDASVRDGFVSVQVRVEALRFATGWLPVDGGATISVGGAAGARPGEWRRGREIEAPVTYRRPARYLDEGVPDFERDLALAGTSLFGSVKSALLVDLVRHGNPLEEWAARFRAHVRLAVNVFVGHRSPLSAAIVTAVLIGDRTGLPDDVRTRLQAAGTYHVIAISGGNIAILGALSVGLLSLTGVARRPAAALTLMLLVAYAAAITAGPSVWRATLMAVIYLGARLLDHRAPARQSMAVAALLLIALQPLDIRDVGFLLTFGATGALLEVADHATRASPLPAFVRWALATVCASLAIEIVLLPVAAGSFSRVTAAGLALNLIAIPSMAATQIAGMLVVAAASFPPLAAATAWGAHAGATMLVESARLVELLPWLTARVPPPPWWLVVIYYVALAVVVISGRIFVRASAAILWAIAAVAIITGRPSVATSPDPANLRLTMLDVGQGESLLLQLPEGRTLVVDTGGAPFGSGAFDVGARVLAPALWGRGIRRLDTVLVTHGDPDHIGGAESVVDDFRPREVWEGIPVPRNVALAELHAAVRRTPADLRMLRAGDMARAGDVTIRVLHPSEPDWERQKVRNDDSVVLEVVYRDVALLLTGDIGAGIERQILPQLTPARTRVLKVAHHGSRTSTSMALLEAWRPQVALISAGRANTFGHPAPVVLERLRSIGAHIYRTDLDGEITLSTDGRSVDVTTYVKGRAP